MIEVLYWYSEITMCLDNAFSKFNYTEICLNIKSSNVLYKTNLFMEEISNNACFSLQIHNFVFTVSSSLSTVTLNEIPRVIRKFCKIAVSDVYYSKCCLPDESWIMRNYAISHFEFN